MKKREERIEKMNDYAKLPTLYGKKMYRGMELDRLYTLAELGITYDD